MDGHSRSGRPRRRRDRAAPLRTRASCYQPRIYGGFAGSLVTRERLAGAECSAACRPRPTSVSGLLAVSMVKYPKVIVPIITGRGCGWGVCTFCSDVTSTAGRTFRSRSPENVLAELEYQYRRLGARLFVFTDLKLNSDLEVWRALGRDFQKAVPGARWIGAVHVGHSGENGLSRRRPGSRRCRRDGPAHDRLRVGKSAHSGSHGQRRRSRISPATFWPTHIGRTSAYA